MRPQDLHPRRWGGYRPGAQRAPGLEPQRPFTALLPTAEHGGLRVLGLLTRQLVSSRACSEGCQVSEGRGPELSQLQLCYILWIKASPTKPRFKGWGLQKGVNTWRCGSLMTQKDSSAPSHIPRKVGRGLNVFVNL